MAGRQFGLVLELTDTCRSFKMEHPVTYFAAPGYKVTWNIVKTRIIKIGGQELMRAEWVEQPTPSKAVYKINGKQFTMGLFWDSMKDIMDWLRSECTVVFKDSVRLSHCLRADITFLSCKPEAADYVGMAVEHTIEYNSMGR